MSSRLTLLTLTSPCVTSHSFDVITSSTTSPNVTLDRTDDLIVIETVTLAIILILAVLGSCLVFCLLIPKRHKLARVHHFMLNLSIADLLVALLHILPTMIIRSKDDGYIHGVGDVICKLYNYILLVPIYASSNLLVTTAVDRYSAICHPMRNYSWTKRRTYSMITSAWLLAFVLASPQIFLFKFDVDNDMCTDVWSSQPEYAVQLYTVYYLSCVFLLPLLLLICMYSRITFVVWSTARGRNTRKPMKNQLIKPGRNSLHNVGVPRSHSGRAFSRAKLKTVLLTFVVVCVFIICWLPYSLCMLWWAFQPGLENYQVFSILTLLTSLNSCCNAYIYLAFTGHCNNRRAGHVTFESTNRKPLREIFLRILCGCKSSGMDFTEQDSLEGRSESLNRELIRDGKIEFNTFSTSPCYQMSPLRSIKRGSMPNGKRVSVNSENHVVHHGLIIEHDRVTIV